MKTLNFTDRLSYLAWRKEWKAAYAQVSHDIPRTKNEFKTVQRTVVMAEVGSANYRYFVPYIDGKHLGASYYDPMRKLDRYRQEANHLLELLILAKEKSGIQRAAMIAERFPEAV